MKYTIVICLAFLCISGASAQNETELLQNYKYRFQQYKRLNVNFNGRSNQSSQTDYTWNTQARDFHGYQNHRYLGSLQRFKQINTEKIQLTSTTGFNGTFDLARRNSRLTDYSLWGYISQSDEYRYYYRSNNFRFIYSNFYGQIGHEKTKNEAPGSQAYSGSLRDRSALDFNISAGQGKGRLENVSDMSFALFWLKDMRAKGIIGEYTNEQAVMIAKALTHTRNTRILDFRFNTIGQMKMLDSAFQASGLLHSTGAEYYTTLYDHYLYANNYQRFHGKRFEYGFQTAPGSDYFYDIQNRDTSYAHFSQSSTSRYVGNMLFAKFIVNRAISLKNQVNYYFGLSAGHRISLYKFKSFPFTPISSKFSYSSAIANIQTGINCQHYLSSRNYLDAGIELNGMFANDLTTSNIEINGISRQYLNYYHWFSPKLNFNLGVNFYENYNRRISSFTDYRFYQNGNLNLGLNYYFY